MEILNNIWTAISTPNEGLVDIMMIPSCFLEILLSMYLLINFLNINTLKKQRIIYPLLATTTTLLTLYFIPAPFNSFFNYILVFLFMRIIFKTSILKTIFAVILPTVILGLIGTLLINPLIKTIDIEYEIAQTIPIYRFIILTISYSMVFFILKIAQNKNFYFNILEEFDKKTKLMLFLTFILAFIVLAIQIIITNFYTDKLPVVITSLSFITLLIYFVINISSITRITSLTITKKQLENAEEYNKTLQILHDSVRCFKHDYDNTVATIGGYVKTNDMEGLKKYYKELEDDVIKVSGLYMLNPNVINNPGIYSLLATKYHKAEELDIKINLTVLLDLNTINMKIYEFSKILGILLDNSIDASKECDEKEINITFRDDSKNNRQLLIIENTYLDKNVDINKIFEKGETSKKDHTGLGLWEIRKILKRNNNLNLHTTKTEKYFKQQFEIFYK